MAASKQTDTHMHACNAVLVVCAQAHPNNFSVGYTCVPGQTFDPCGFWDLNSKECMCIVWRVEYTENVQQTKKENNCTSLGLGF